LNAGGWFRRSEFKSAYALMLGDKEISVLGADKTVIDTSLGQGDFGTRAQKCRLLFNANFMVCGGKVGLKYAF